MSYPVAFIDLTTTGEADLGGEVVAIAATFGDLEDTGGREGDGGEPKGPLTLPSPPRGEGFFTLVRPDDMPPEERLRALGITEEDLRKAPDRIEAAERLLREVRGMTAMVEDAERDSRFLDSLTSTFFTVPVLGLKDVGRVAEPTCPAGDLGGLMRFLGMERSTGGVCSTGATPVEGCSTGASPVEGCSTGATPVEKIRDENDETDGDGTGGRGARRHTRQDENAGGDTRGPRPHTQGQVGNLPYGLARARAMKEVTRRLWAKLLEIPLPAIAEMNWLVSKVDHPLAKLMKRIESLAMASKFAEHFLQRKTKLADLFTDFGEIVTARREPIEEESAETIYLEPKRIAAALAPDGPLAEGLADQFEERPQQYEMAAAVADAFNRGAHVMVEAGTGTGKSLAYLVPAVLWAVRTKRVVLISTHTKNLQSQLMDKDLPFLHEHLGVEFRSALLKGRTNYLCVRKLLYLLQESAQELTEEERLKLLPTVAWAVRTETGDVAENAAILSGERRDLWDRLCTVGEDCMGRSCPHFRRCFVYRARGLAHLSDVLVINHALFFSELGLENGTLPPYREVIFDEAHNIEDVATEHLTVEVTASRVYGVLHRLFRARRRGKGGRGREREGDEPAGKGLLPSLMHAVSSSKASDHEAAEICRTKLVAAMKAVVACPDAVSEYLDAFAGLMREGEETDRVRFAADRLTEPQKETLSAAKGKLVAALGAVRQPLEIIVETLKALRASPLPRLREYKQEVGAGTSFLAELMHDVEFASAGAEPNYVYFVEELFGRAKKGAVRVAAAPLDLAPLLHGQLFDKVRSCALTSATLRCGSSFEFLKGRLGLTLCGPERAFDIAIGTPFDYRRQSQVLVPSFLPDPSEPGFNRALSEVLTEVFRAAGGRGLVLYTSYAALREGYDVLRKALTPEGFGILAQGVDGTREALLDRLRRGGKTVLLGTSSFWEGIDVRGEALSVLAIAKLPFPVFTDPIHQGRCEILESQGKDPFMNLSVPLAILRLRQGFGRLIRSRTDRGVVILADKRLITRRYGGLFLRSLPTPHRVVNAAEALTRMVHDFLAGAAK